MSETNDSLQILREYTCGCIVYRRYDSTVSRWVESDERGLMCCGVEGYDEHKRALVQGAETQPDLFNVPIGTRHLDVQAARKRGDA